MTDSSPPPLLDVKSLTVRFGGASPRPALREVALRIERGESVGLLGESGSGKSLLALAATGMLPREARVEGGRVEVDGRDLSSLSPGELRALRGTRVGLIFQEPMSALSPVRSVRDHFHDVLKAHRQAGRSQSREIALRLLESLRVADASRVLEQYPAQLSGGMRQRVLIALALACEPALVIADEVTTAIDAAARRELLELLRTAVRERNAALLVISHDIDVLAALCERLVVMYRGCVMERGPVAALLEQPRHPYTRMLLGARPGAAPPKSRLATATSAMLETTGLGCGFAARCARADTQCESLPRATHLCGDSGPASQHVLHCWHPEPAR